MTNTFTISAEDREKLVRTLLAAWDTIEKLWHVAKRAENELLGNEPVQQECPITDQLRTTLDACGIQDTPLGCQGGAIADIERAIIKLAFEE